MRTRCPLLYLPSPKKKKHVCRVHANQVIYGVAELLLATQALGCLHGSMPRRKLNLFQFTAGRTTQATTCSAQIMRSKIL